MNVLKYTIVLLLASLALSAQTMSTNASRTGLILNFSKQPLESQRAIFFGKIPGVALYEILTCNISEVPREISGGTILVYARTPIINPLVAQSTVYRGEGRTKRAKTILTVQLVGSLATLLMSSGVIKTDSVTQGTIASTTFTLNILNAFIPILTNELNKSDSSIRQLLDNLVDPKEHYLLAAKSCDTRLFLGSFIQGYQGHQVELE